MTSNSATITPLFTKDVEEDYEFWFNLMVLDISNVISGNIDIFTLDEIKEAFAEAVAKFEENNIGA